MTSLREVLNQYTQAEVSELLGGKNGLTGIEFAPELQSQLREIVDRVRDRDSGATPEELDAIHELTLKACEAQFEKDPIKVARLIAARIEGSEPKLLEVLSETPARNTPTAEPVQSRGASYTPQGVYQQRMH